MEEHDYITETGERVRERRGLVEVGLSPEVQVALGHLLHFQSLKIGDRVKEGDHLFVVEGKLTAAEFYAPVSIRLDQAVFGVHVRSALTSAFAISMSLRMTTTMATFAGFPTLRRASYLALSSGLNRIATSAGM